MACAPSAGGALTVSLLLAGAPDGLANWSGVGTVEWFGMLTASAVSFVLLLTFVPRLAARWAVGLPLCAAAAGWIV